MFCFFLFGKWEHIITLISSFNIYNQKDDSRGCRILKIDYVVLLWIHGISLGHSSHPKLARARLSAQMLALVLESQRLWFMKLWLWYKHPCYLFAPEIWHNSRWYFHEDIQCSKTPPLCRQFLSRAAFPNTLFQRMNHSFVKNEKKRAQIPSKQFRGFAAHITDIMLPAREHWIGLLTESINATL